MNNEQMLDHQALLLQLTINIKAFPLKRYPGDHVTDLRDRIEARFFDWLQAEGLRYADAAQYGDDEQLGRMIVRMFRRSQPTRMLWSDSGASLAYLRRRVTQALSDEARFEVVSLRAGAEAYYCAGEAPAATGRCGQQFSDTAEFEVPLTLRRRERNDGVVYEWWSDAAEVRAFAEALLRYVGRPLSAREVTSVLRDSVRYDGELMQFDICPGADAPEPESDAFAAPDTFVPVTDALQAALNALDGKVSPGNWRVAERRLAGMSYDDIGTELGGRRHAMVMRYATFRAHFRSVLEAAQVDGVNEANWILAQLFLRRMAGLTTGVTP